MSDDDGTDDVASCITRDARLSLFLSPVLQSKQRIQRHLSIAMQQRRDDGDANNVRWQHREQQVQDIPYGAKVLMRKAGRRVPNRDFDSSTVISGCHGDVVTAPGGGEALSCWNGLQTLSQCAQFEVDLTVPLDLNEALCLGAASMCSWVGDDDVCGRTMTETFEVRSRAGKTSSIANCAVGQSRAAAIHRLPLVAPFHYHRAQRWTREHCVMHCTLHQNFAI